jgi:hypothetical protein
MRAKWLHALVLATLTVCLPGLQLKSQTKSTTASGTFLGRSGKPMAGARLILADAPYDGGKVKILPDVPTVTTDQAGKFTFRGFSPGSWTVIYLPAGVEAAISNEIDISALEAMDTNPLPLLVKVELGTSKPAEPRTWTKQFTLLKGHTFWSLGKQMRIWNATARRNPQGPFFEIRRGRILTQPFDDKAQIKLDAWSF